MNYTHPSKLAYSFLYLSYLFNELHTPKQTCIFFSLLIFCFDKTGHSFLSLSSLVLVSSSVDLEAASSSPFFSSLFFLAASSEDESALAASVDFFSDLPSSSSDSGSSASASNFVPATASFNRSAAFFSSSSLTSSTLSDLDLNSVKYSVMDALTAYGRSPSVSTMSGSDSVSFFNKSSASSSILILCSSRSSLQ